MVSANCPSCETTVNLSDHLKIGYKVTCPRCKERLLVLQLKPVELDWVDGADWERDADREAEGKKRPRSENSRDAQWSRYSWDRV